MYMQMQMAKMIMHVAPRVLSWVWKGLNTVHTKLTTWYRDWQARRAPKLAAVAAVAVATRVAAVETMMTMKMMEDMLEDDLPDVLVL